MAIQTRRFQVRIRSAADTMQRQAGQTNFQKNWAFRRNAYIRFRRPSIRGGIDPMRIPPSLYENVIRRVLFGFDAEVAHHIAMFWLTRVSRSRALLRLLANP